MAKSASSLSTSNTDINPLPASSKSERLRQRVIEVALKHFSQYSWEGASIRHIAREAKTTHPLILYHFKSKEKLWEATMQATVGVYSESIVDLFAGEASEPAHKVLKKFIEMFVKLSAEHPEIHSIITMPCTQDSYRAKWLVDTFLKDHYERVVSLIRRGQEEGTVRQSDPARLYYLIIGAAGTPFSIYKEYKLLTGRNVFSETEILRSIALIYEVVFPEIENSD